LWPGNTAIEHSSDNPEIKGLDPAIGIGSMKMAQKSPLQWLLHGNTAVEHWTQTTTISRQFESYHFHWERENDKNMHFSGCGLETQQ
jgi:hypothetical protein